MKEFGETSEELERAIRAVGQDMATAMGEVALEVGGEDFAASVSGAAGLEAGVFNPDAMKMLLDRDQASAELVVARMKQIGNERRALQSAELKRHNFRRVGKALLEGFGYLGGGMARIGEGMSRISLVPPRHDRDDD